ncbi:hypothetical protein CHU98_g8309 [Xylaria longipes]|nr:hypothetical protein CHU98_g8309 [Xylaria longipes]
MTLVYNDQEHPVKVLLDPGSTVPVMSFSKARQWKLPLIKRRYARPINAFNGTTDGEGGRYYTEALVLRHQEDHFTRLNFELTKMDGHDIILPHWWLQRHQPTHFFANDAGEITFSSDFC